MATEIDEKREVARFFTRSRRFRKFLGRLPDGTKLPGGPYTVTQGLVLALVLIGACITQGLWGTGAPLVDFPLAGAFAWVAAWAAGRIPMTRRNLFSVIMGGLTAMTRTGAGSYRGSALRIKPPHQATGRSYIGAAPSRPIAPAPAEPVIAAAPAVPVLEPARVTTVPAGTAARPAMSGVTAMLLQARTEVTASHGHPTTTSTDD